MVGCQDFPRSLRLPDGKAFRAVFACREIRSNPLFRLHLGAGASDDDAHAADPRLGIAVSRRVSKRAVERNRIRRQVRESFRLNRLRLPARDYVVVARSAAAGASNPQLRQALEALWRQAGQSQPVGHRTTP